MSVYVSVCYFESVCLFVCLFGVRVSVFVCVFICVCALACEPVCACVNLAVRSVGVRACVRLPRRFGGCRRLGNISQLSQSSLVRRNRPSPDPKRL